MKRIINTEHKEIDLKRNYQQGKDLKPSGLWYSIDNEWIEWCEENMEEWVKDGIIEIDIDLDRIMIIETKEQLKGMCKNFNLWAYGSSHYIDWEKIAQNYSGIEIRNYQELKWGNALPDLDALWFWGWDVSSGCIWDLSIVKSFAYSQMILAKEKMVQQ